MTWAHRLCAYDVESTGVNDQRTDRIVTAAVIHIQPGQPVDVHEWLVAVDIDIPPGATEVHKITTASARTHGRPAADVIAEIGDELRRGWAAGEVLCAFNAAYDLTITADETRRWLGRDFPIMGGVADPMVLDKIVDKYRKGSRRLGAVAEHYGVKIDGELHGSTTDALVAARVAWKLARLFPEVGDLDVRALYRLQVRAKAEQAAGLQDHLRAKARDAGESVEAVEAIVIDQSWPIAPVPVPATAAATTE
jgi:DNA polymerase-3 subunit epsilon